jgi:hypothetical protein
LAGKVITGKILAGNILSHFFRTVSFKPVLTQAATKN